MCKNCSSGYEILISSKHVQFIALCNFTALAGADPGGAWEGLSPTHPLPKKERKRRDG